jgi:hypothetical protein
MRNPPGEEQQRICDISGIEASVDEEVAGVIQGHDHHDQAAQSVHRTYPRLSATIYGVTLLAEIGRTLIRSEALCRYILTAYF